jgi:hypothetical protein
VRVRETVGYARDLLGGNGILPENHVGRFVAGDEAIYSYGGTREINTLIVGRAITGTAHLSEPQCMRHAAVRSPAPSLSGRPLLSHAGFFR